MNVKSLYQESLKSCIENKEINNLLSDINLSNEDLSKLLIPKKDKLLEKINKELDEIELLEKQLEKAIDARRLLLRKKLPYQAVSKYLLWGLITIVSILLLLLIIWFIWKPNIFNTSISFLSNLKSMYIIVISVISGLIITLNIIYKQLNNRKIKLFNIEDAQKETGRKKLEFKKNEFIKKTKEKLKNNIIVPEIILICNEIGKANYSCTFDLISIKSLSSDYSSKYEVLTENKNDLTKLLERVQSGTIGISGPRGIGKSLMLKTFYSSTKRVINDKKVLPIITSAPMKYETREFTTHLFSKVIDEYLKKDKGRPIDNSKLVKPVETNKSIDSWLQSILKPAMFIGMFLVLMNILLLLVNPKIDATEQNNKKVETKEYSLTDLDFYNKYKLGIWGIIFLSATFFVQFDILERRRRINYAEKDFYDKGRNSIADNWKEKLKYQMSYTSGWSGAIKSSIGLEAGINSSTSMAQNQLSLPEIVEGFKSFVDEIQRQYKIVIAIDELDKIHSATDLNLFLNEIKALFEIENCIFLITISEEASNSFINREISSKNVLDSSFDEIIKLDYLNYNQTKELIQKRVLGLSIPFIIFIYVYSGGLPREIIRLLRCMMSYESVKGKIDLENIIENVCIEDVKSKINSLLENEKFVSSVFLKPIYQDLFITRSLNQLGWNELKNIISDLNKLCGEFKDVELRITLHKLTAYISFIYEIGNLFKGNFDFKTNIENKTNEIEKLSDLFRMINYNPIYIIETLKNKNWRQHFV